MIRQRRVWVGGLAIALSAIGCATGDEAPGAASTGGELEVAQGPSAEGHPGRFGRRGDRGPRAHNPEQRLERMRERLELTDAQVEQVRPILEQARERGRGNRAEVREELAAVLTPEQLAKLDEHMQGRRGRHGRRGGPMAGRLFRELELTDAQKEQVRPILESARERRRAIRELPVEERRAAIEAAQAEVRAQLVPILEAEQLTRFDEISERMRGRFERGHQRRMRRGAGAGADAPEGAIDPNGI